MKYRIEKGNSGKYLYGFFPNGGWRIGDVFSLKKNGNIFFETEKEAQEYLLRMEKTLDEQYERWGSEWHGVAKRFYKSLLVKSYYND